LLSLISFCSFAQTQNLEGKWKGVITMDTSGYYKQVITFSVQFRQSGNAIWGIYVKGNDPVKNTADCTGRLTAGLNNKNGSVIKIFQDGIEKNNIPLDLCLYMNFLEADYSKEENAEYLKGKWFGNPNYRRYGVDRASGSFQLEKTSPVVDIEVDKYFPNLARLIKEFNSD
ncbi:MAG: hypothetical protein AAB221_04925, partial [Bacteroidota bacterium]